MQNEALLFFGASVLFSFGLVISEKGQYEGEVKNRHNVKCYVKGEFSIFKHFFHN